MAYQRPWLAFLLLMPALLRAAETSPEPEQARRLVANGRLDEAERLVRAAIRGNDAPALKTSLGDILFRHGDFAGAADAYRSAATLDPNCARAWWGLGRIELAQFQRRSARELISKAFSLDPRDPDIILSYLDFTVDAGSRITLLRNALLLTRNSDRGRAEEILGQLDLERGMQGLQVAKLVSPYQAYTLRLGSFLPAGPKSYGVLLSVSINQRKPLRLLLDSGARGITLDSRAARQLGLRPIAKSRIGGLGTSGPVQAEVTLAEAVAVGELRLQNCVVEVTAEALTGGADGIIGMNLFEAFEIRLDARNHVLQLKPFADRMPVMAGPVWADHNRPSIPEDARGALAYGFRHFLLVRTRANGKEGLFLVDTGSSVTSVAHEIAPPMVLDGAGRALHGAGGEVGDAYRISPIRLEVAGRTLIDSDPVSMSLTEISHREGVTISGILGYAALSRAPLTINYRDGLVDLGTAH